MNPPSDLPPAAAALDLSRLPRHVAIIMDGNGRWAKLRGYLRVRGHLTGVESVRVIVRLARKLGIEYLTLYAFSDENWQRPTTEIRALMSILSRFVRKELAELKENQILIRAIGDLARLPENVQRELAQAEEASREGARMTLSLALSMIWFCFSSASSLRTNRDRMFMRARISAEGRCQFSSEKA